tara:strand:- start:454 stop:777 length:324 start_codon:yes stop_codon:yes gene_type:complete
MASKIKKGDNVFILTGKDKGKTGKVLKVIKNSTIQDKVIVEGVNIVKKHTKQSASQKGGIESVEMPIYISNLSIVDPKTSKPSRIGFKILKDGKKVRFAKKSGETLS